MDDMSVSLQNATLWITIANLIYLASYAVRDILWLRVLTVVGAALLIPFYLLQPLPLVTAIAWNIVFIIINAYWIVRLIVERRPVHLAPDEQHLRELSFPSLTAREAQNLFAMGRWDDIIPGASLVEHDKTEDKTSVILRGVTDVLYHDAKIAELGEGQFVGEIVMRGLTRDLDVVTRSETRTMAWPRTHLQAFMATRPDVALALSRSVGLELRHLFDTIVEELKE